MPGASTFGLLIGGLMPMLPRLLGARLGWMVLWSTFAFLGARTARAVWQRTRLRITTANMAYCTALSIVFSIAALLGIPWPDLTRLSP